MAEPPGDPAVDANSRKRRCEDDVPNGVKRLRASDYPRYGADENVYPSRDTTQVVSPELYPDESSASSSMVASDAPTSTAHRSQLPQIPKPFRRRFEGVPEAHLNPPLPTYSAATPVTQYGQGDGPLPKPLPSRPEPYHKQSMQYAEEQLRKLYAGKQMMAPPGGPPAIGLPEMRHQSSLQNAENGITARIVCGTSDTRMEGQTGPAQRGLQHVSYTQAAGAQTLRPSLPTSSLQALHRQPVETLFRDRAPHASPEIAAPRVRTQGVPEQKQAPQHLSINLDRSKVIAYNPNLPKQWLHQASPDLASGGPVLIPTILPTHAKPQDENIKLYLPRDVWDIRYLAPRDRANIYIELCAFGHIMQKDNPGSETYRAAFELIFLKSIELGMQENEWYSQFSDPQYGTHEDRKAQFEKIALQQAKAAPEPFLVAPALSQAELKSSESPLTNISATSPNARAGSSPDTAITINSSDDIGAPSQCLVEENVATESRGTKRAAPVAEETEEERAAKRARTELIVNERRQYDENKDEIEKWWKTKGKHPKALWCEKLSEWRVALGIIEPPPPRKRTAQPTVQARETIGTQIPNNVPHTPDMTSPAEIIQWRKQWEGSRPDQRKHPKDLVAVPEYPQEDTIENSTKLPNGRYRCRHVNENRNCCRDGVEREAKKRSIYKAKTDFYREIERAIIAGNLHVAHKTWNIWHDKKIANKLRMGEVNALLQPVQNPQPVAAAAAPRKAVGNNQQRKQPQKANTASPVPSPLVPAAQQAKNVGSALTAQALAVLQANDSGTAAIHQASTAPVVEPPPLQPQSSSGVQATVPAMPPATIQDEPRPRPEASQKTAPAPRKVVLAASKPLPNPDFALRRTAMEEIQRQIGTTEAVIVAGINISKEPYSRDMNRTIDKIVRALKQEAEEAAEEAAKEEAARQEEALAEAAKEALLPDSAEAVEEIQDPVSALLHEGAGSVLMVPFEPDDFLSSDDNSYISDLALQRLVDCVPDEVWAQPSTFGLDDLMNDDAPDFDMTRYLEPEPQSLPMGEHAQQMLAPQDRTVVPAQDQASLDDFEQAVMDVLNSWESEDI